MNIKQAKKVDLIEFLEKLGYKEAKRRGKEHWYLSPIRTENTPSFKVNSETNEWYDYGMQEGGDIIDLCKHIYNVRSVSEALATIAREVPTLSNRAQRIKNSVPTRQESFEMRNIQYVSLSHTALLSYLIKRKIDIHIARVYCCEIHYDIRNKHYFGIAFRNRNGGFEVRNQYFKGCVGHKDISYFRMNSEHIQERCLVFEGFMNYLSFLTLQHRKIVQLLLGEYCDYVVLNSVNNIKKAIEVLKPYKYVHCFLDNDEAGVKALEIIKSEAKAEIINEAGLYSAYNDLNDYLVYGT